MEQTSQDFSFGFGLFLGVLLGLVGMVMAVVFTNNNWKSELIQNGHAQWAIDAKTGVKRFEYLHEGSFFKNDN